MQVKEIELLETFESLYGIVIARITPEKITHELEASIATPHRHNCYTVILIETGVADFTIDFQELEIKANSMLFIRPGQVHQTRLRGDISGWIMLFDGKLIDQNARFAMEQSLQNTIVLHLKKSAISVFNRLFLFILDSVLEDNPGKSHELFLRSLLNALLFKSTDLLYLEEDNKVAVHKSRAIEIARKFNQLVKENFRSKKRPSDYAKLLNITVSHLTDTLTAVTGFSCTYIIQQEIITEAQRLLFYTSKSVKEIAYELGYNDYKYFIRQFGIVTKKTPLSFRKQTAVFSYQNAQNSETK
jgi:AraC family transcriptional activator of pobA